MDQRSARFSHAAAQARERNPRGVSKKEGWLIILQASASVVMMSIFFQAHNWYWGGILNFASVGVFLILAVMMSTRMARVRAVHPTGHRRRLLLASLLPLLAIAIGGWYWTSHAPHSGSWLLTTSVAVLSCVPLVVLGYSLVARGNR